jgi:hypothetical protein
VLEDDDVVLRQQGLFPFHVDEHVRIALAEIVQGDPSSPSMACSSCLLARELCSAGCEKMTRMRFMGFLKRVCCRHMRQIVS